MNELKCCPFCKGEADCNNGSALRWVECIHCGVATPGHTSKNEAIAAWNRRADDWISVEERLPEPEKRVLACIEISHAGTTRTPSSFQRIVMAMYEDGTVWREDSDWNFNEYEHLEEYDEVRDDWRIPKGWWEYSLYAEESGNYSIDDTVTHWKPLPEPPKGE